MSISKKICAHTTNTYIFQAMPFEICDFSCKKWYLGEYLYLSHTLFILYLERNHTLFGEKNILYLEI